MSAPMASRIGKYLILSRQFINRGHVLSSNAQIIPVRFKTKQDKGKDKGGEKSRWMIRQEEKRKKLKAEKKKEKSESTLKFGALECPYPNEMYKKRIPVDPVWSPRHYPVQFSTHSVEKSLEMHRELADPSMMDDMNKYVYLELRFDTEITKEVMVKGGKKETKVSYLESISDYLKFPHMFETKEKRRVMVFCKPEEVELALSNGAEIAGGKELADQVDNNEIDWKNMDVILGTVDALPDILSVRKKIKNKLPTQKSGTLGVDLVEMLKKHTDGIGMTSFPVKANISIMKVKVGTLDMPDKEIIANMDVVVKSVMQQRSNMGPITKPFIFKALTKTEPGENIIIDIDRFLPKKKEKTKVTKTSSQHAEAISMDTEQGEAPVTISGTEPSLNIDQNFQPLST